MVAFNDQREGGGPVELHDKPAHEAVKEMAGPRWAHPAAPEDDNPPSWGHRNSPIHSAVHGVIHPWGYPSNSPQAKAQADHSSQKMKWSDRSGK